MDERRQRGGLVGAAILIALGVVFLLNNVGVLSWDIWAIIIRLWPIVLIGIGLELLFGRRSAQASLLVLLVTTLLFAGGVWYVATQARDDTARTEEVSQSLEGARNGDVELASGVGVLRLGALPAGSPALIQGRVDLLRGEQLERDFRPDGDTARFTLRSKSGRTGFFPFIGPGGDNRNPAWDLQLNRDVPMQLKVNTGVGESTLDLGQLRLTNLDVNAGVGKTTISLPSGGQVQASVNGGVGEMIVQIPEGTAARIQVHTGLGGADVQGNYQRQDDVYTSPGFDSAANRITLDVRGGVGRITIQPYRP